VYKSQFCMWKAHYACRNHTLSYWNDTWQCILKNERVFACIHVWFIIFLTRVRVGFCELMRHVIYYRVYITIFFLNYWSIFYKNMVYWNFSSYLSLGPSVPLVRLPYLFPSVRLCLICSPFSNLRSSNFATAQNFWDWARIRILSYFIYHLSDHALLCSFFQMLFSFL
jgi:hypothetical protein